MLDIDGHSTDLKCNQKYIHTQANWCIWIQLYVEYVTVYKKTLAILMSTFGSGSNSMTSFWSSMHTLDPGWHLQAPPRRRVEAWPHLRLGRSSSNATLMGLIQIMSSIVHIYDFLIDSIDFNWKFLPDFDVAMKRIDTKQHALLCFAEACWPARLGKTVVSEPKPTERSKMVWSCAVHAESFLWNTWTEVGYIVLEYFRWPGYLSPEKGIKFADMPHGIAAISKAG